MTDHTQDELRRWCELAGLHSTRDAGRNWYWATAPIHTQEQRWESMEESPMLLPYVAELLTVKVRDSGLLPAMGVHCALKMGVSVGATAAQRCRAAEKVMTRE